MSGFGVQRFRVQGSGIHGETHGFRGSWDEGQGSGSKRCIGADCYAERCCCPCTVHVEPELPAMGKRQGWAVEDRMRATGSTPHSTSPIMEDHAACAASLERCTVQWRLCILSAALTARACVQAQRPCALLANPNQPAHHMHLLRVCPAACRHAHTKRLRLRWLPNALVGQTK